LFLSQITSNASGVASAVSLPAAVAIASAAFLISGVVKTGERRYQWLNIFKNLGQPQNFGYFYSSYGFYNHFLRTTDADNMHRGVCTSTYLTEGRWNVTDEISQGVTKVNNADREASVFLSLGTGFNINYPSTYVNFDNSNNNNQSSRFVSSDKGCTDIYTTARIGSPYISIKEYVPDQYGRINTVSWLGTGACGDLLEPSECNGVFGGDIYISRFSWKRKMPMFLNTAVGIAPLTPFKYETYKNIPTLKYFANYEIDDNLVNIGTLLFPDNRTDTSNMDCIPTLNEFYVKPPTKIYLYYYGIPYFLVESEINCWLRYAKREQQERFYPQTSDYVNWTQEQNVSIREPNTFFYNAAYSQQGLALPVKKLSDSYDSEREACLNEYPNGVIYSAPDVDENSSYDPWLVFKPFNFTELPTSYGDLVDLRFIESNQLLGRFENQVVLYNRLNDYLDGTQAGTTEAGSGSLFAVRPIEFNSTDLGYTGTQNKAMVSCEYGHYWVDAKRGQVFEMAPGGKGLIEITTGVRNWFKENLPFKILKSNIEGITYKDTDNSYNGLGITMAWDDRYRRVFITKRDYKLKQGCTNNVYFRDCKFYTLIEDVETEIKLTDTDYFEDCSFTIAYSPILKGWVGYYSFTPDYYISYLNYFQSGINNSDDETEEGLWSHLLTNQSFQVFYGKRYPWKIEVPLIEQYSNGIVHNVHYWLEVRAYLNKYDFSERDDLGFNTAYIYNSSANTGRLNLITEIPNNLKQKMDYPRFNTDSVDILASSKYKKWSFNYIYDLATNKNNNVPIWINDCNQIDKTINPSAVKYMNTWKNRLQGDWFLTRLEQNKESRYKFIFKWNQDKRNFFNG